MTESGYGKVYHDAVRAGMVLPMDRPPTFEELSEDFPDDKVPPLDRESVAGLSLSREQRQWRDQGFLILPGFIPLERIDAYLDLRARVGIGAAGWGTATPYLYFEEIKDICVYGPLSDLLRELIGDDMGMHFNIPMFRSTERFWHQDDYLNPPGTYSWYAAAWFACGDIHPDCGPFEYVPGSHKWPCMRSDRVREYLKPEAREVYGGEKGHWAQHAEVFTNPAYLKKLEESGAERRTFLARKGDVLVWHGRLLHRGSLPKDPNRERPAIITHYSSVDKRKDLGDRIRRHPGGGLYWDFPYDQPLPNWADPVNATRMLARVGRLEDRVEDLEAENARLRRRYALPEALRERAKSAAPESLRNWLRQKRGG